GLMIIQSIFPIRSILEGIHTPERWFLLSRNISLKVAIDAFGMFSRQRPPISVPPPMCWYGDDCKVTISEKDHTYQQRYWTCTNYAYSSEKPKPQGKSKKLVE
ncbi:hypothetical protein E2562_019307, partial [Oryza meyeriana var. granulata]